MKKIMYSILSTFVLMGLLSVQVMAKPSIVLNGMPDGYVLQYGKMVAGSYAVFETIESQSSTQTIPVKVQKQIQKMNQGNSVQTVLETQNVQTKLDLSKYALLTQIQDLKAYDSDGNRLDKEVTVTWEVPNLTQSNICQLCILHYSTIRQTWETIHPDQVDLENNKVTVTFKDLSPVAVMYDTTNTCDATTTTETTNTGVQSNRSWYTMAALVSIVIGFLLIIFGLKKKKA